LAPYISVAINTPVVAAHGRGDDADHGRLLGDVVEVLRRQEIAGGDVKGECHHRQYAGHDRQAQIERTDLKIVLCGCHGCSAFGRVHQLGGA
jgi:hypothetical protein